MTSPPLNSNTGHGARPVLPTIDLSAFLSGTATEQGTIARQVDDSCRHSGFLIIENHGVDERTIADAWNSAAQFFELPLARKLAARSSDPRCPRGYFPPQSETLSRSRGVPTPPDQKEAFSSGPLLAPDIVCGDTEFDFHHYFHYGQNIWPDEPAAFRDSWIRYYQAMDKLGSHLMSLLAAALQLQRDYFVGFHTHQISALRALNYPSTDAALIPANSAPAHIPTTAA
jgi:isopenicillin N synthase-like dioxygenase